MNIPFLNKKIEITLNAILTIVIIAIMVLLALFRIKVGQSTGLEFDEMALAVYDSNFFVKNAMFFEKFSYSEPLGLIKNRSFIWTLMLFHYLKISPQTGIALLWIISAIFIFIMNHYIKLTNLNQFIDVFEPSKDYENKYFDYFNIKSEKNYISYYWFVYELINCYSSITTFLTISTILVLLAIVVVNFIDYKKYFLNKTNNLDLFSCINVLVSLTIVFILDFVLYIFAISGFLIWLKYNWDNYQYLETLYYNYVSTAFAFMIMSFI